MAEDDWFDALDEDLKKKTEEIIQDVGEQNTKKVDANKALISDFWKIWVRFNRINVHFTMEPSHSAFAQFDEFPEGWRFKPKFDFAGINVVQLIDRTQDQGRLGDSLKVRYYNIDKKTHLRIVFEFCEGEHYYKYSGWKRIFGQHIIYDSPLDKVSLKKIHEQMAALIKVWYESHLRRNRDLIIKYLRDNFEKGETFTQ